MIQRLFLFGFLFVYMSVWHCNSSYAKQDIIGNGSKELKATFDFKVGPSAATIEGAGIYFGAHASAAGKSKEYAISCLRADYHEAIGLMSEKVILGHERDVRDNPAYNQGIRCLCLLENNQMVSGDPCRPVFVTEAEPSKIYLLNSFSTNASRLMVADVRDAGWYAKLDDDGKVIVDAQGKASFEQGKADVVGLAAVHRPGGPLDRCSMVGDRIFYVTKPFRGSFGDTGTGIGQCLIYETNIKKELNNKDNQDTNKTDTASINASTNSSTSIVLFAPALIEINGVSGSISADRLDREINSLGRDGKSITKMDYSDMHWDPLLRRLYIGLKIIGGEAGGRAVIVGHIDKDNRCVLSPIAPDTAFVSGIRSIVGTADAGTAVSVHSLRTLFTSTAVHYLIVQGGTGSPDSTRQTVYAMPLCSHTSDVAAHGAIASKSVASQDQFAENGMYVGRAIAAPALISDDMPSEEDPAAQVGCGPLLNGPISSLSVRGDVVFATVSEALEGYQPGIFMSRALFDASGLIKGWSIWSRARTMLDASGNPEAIDAAYTDPKTANILAIHASDTTHIQRTTWSEGSESGSKTSNESISTLLSSSGGVRFGFNHARDTIGLNGACFELFGSDSNLAIKEHGSLNRSGLYEPYTSEQQKLITFSANQISQLQPIGRLNTAAIISSESDSWLIVGGRYGLAILSNPDGTGFNNQVNKQANNCFLAPRIASMQFKKFGEHQNYQWVHKLIADGTFVYVMTSQSLDRIDLSEGLSLTGTGMSTSKWVRLFDSGSRATSSFSVPLFDCVVSQKLAVLATGTGLLRTGNGCDVRTARSSADMQWAAVSMPHESSPPKQLLPITRTGRAQDLSTGQGGQLYILCSYGGKDTAELVRLSIDATDNKSVDNGSVQQFRDLFWKGKPSYLMRFGQFRNLFSTDGWSFFSVRNRIGEGRTICAIPQVSYDRELRTGNRNTGVLGHELFFGVDPYKATVTTLFQNSASGNWVIAGDFGIRVNE